MSLSNIRNFSIIAHIDHGKSTLADRLLEITGTIEKRKMQEQVLDSMELERERGITIKMTPVRMRYSLSDQEYILNLIDTPGHIDFSYEVSRAIKAVEGSILLVDATQGVQAQTLTTLNMAREAGVVIVPVVSKIDMPTARVDEVKEEISKVVGCNIEDIIGVSGKTGENVDLLIREIIKRVPPPKEEIFNSNSFRGLVFDFQYSNHTGVIIYLRVFEGELSKNDNLLLQAVKEKFGPIEVGIFNPDRVAVQKLSAGEIGYVVTGIKRPGIASVSDTLTLSKKPLPALSGYMTPKPVVWASLYPENQGLGGKTGGDDWNLLRQALEKLRLSDSAFTFEEESSSILGRGFRSGFLGMLHLEIITERLSREFGLKLIITSPSIRYEVLDKKGKKNIVYSPALFPEYGVIDKVFEPWVRIKIITPIDYLGNIMKLLYEHEATADHTGNFGENRTSIEADLPLRELMRNNMFMQ
jgi:GTP-binding protein LepA